MTIFVLLAIKTIDEMSYPCPRVSIPKVPVSGM